MARLPTSPFANGSFAKRATQTARQDSARRVVTRNGPYLPPGLPNECLASYIEYDLPGLPNELTPNLSNFRDNAIPDDLFRGSLASLGSNATAAMLSENCYFFAVAIFCSGGWFCTGSPLS